MRHCQNISFAVVDSVFDLVFSEDGYDVVEIPLVEFYAVLASVLRSCKIYLYKARFDASRGERFLTFHADRNCLYGNYTRFQNISSFLVAIVLLFYEKIEKSLKNNGHLEKYVV